MTAKQKVILALLETNPVESTVTSFVKKTSQERKWSESALWLNLKQLRILNLVSYATAKTKGEPLVLTPLGNWLAKSISEEEKP